MHGVKKLKLQCKQSKTHGQQLDKINSQLQILGVLKSQSRSIRLNNLKLTLGAPQIPFKQMQLLMVDGTLSLPSKTMVDGTTPDKVKMKKLQPVEMHRDWQEKQPKHQALDGAIMQLLILEHKMHSQALEAQPNPLTNILDL